ncbi:hypothetical protein JVU11DRAFT_8920 [Chiua virens]|nr:hypothetical protein JVU11DRAFT_8920 [Chiua virens]
MDRPPKKPRLQGPDGFQKSKPTSRYKPPESITKFVSAFDNVPPPSPPKKKHVSSSHARNPFVDFHVPNQPEAGPSKLSNRQLKPASAHQAEKTRVLKPPVFLPPPVDFHVPNQPEAGPSKPSNRQSKPASAHQAEKTLKVLKPPVFLPPPQTTDVEASKSTKPAGTRLSALQPTLKAAAPAPPEKPRYTLKPPPVPIPPATKPSVPLKPLAPPPPLPVPENRVTSPKKPMKTIFTTSVAQATDPTKEGGGAELLSLFLQQHGHNFMSATDRELQRGVMVSPDKRSRGKDPKFVRGGLAERFQHQISCTKTDVALWKRQMERKMDSGAKVGSDMQLRILRVLDVAKPMARPRFTTSPRSGLALCRLTRRHPLTSGDLTLGTYVVLFHFASTQGERSAVSSVDLFQEGNTAMAWLPWQKVGVVGAEEGARLLDMFRALDALTPPHTLLVVSRFVFVAPDDHATT